MDVNEGSRQLAYLEYERSSVFANHVDNVRNVLTSFFLTAVGAALVGLARYSDGSLSGDAIAPPTGLAAALSCSVALLGVLFTLVLARLRRVQLERYKIMNAILDRYLTAADRDLVSFSDVRLAGAPGPYAMGLRSSGSYLWTLVILLASAAMAGVTARIALESAMGGWSWVVAGAVCVICVSLLDLGYFRLSGPWLVKS